MDNHRGYVEYDFRGGRCDENPMEEVFFLIFCRFCSWVAKLLVEVSTASVCRQRFNQIKIPRYHPLFSKPFVAIEQAPWTTLLQYFSLQPCRMVASLQLLVPRTHLNVIARASARHDVRRTEDAAFNIRWLACQSARGMHCCLTWLAS